MKLLKSLKNNKTLSAMNANYLRIQAQQKHDNEILQLGKDLMNHFYTQEKLYRELSEKYAKQLAVSNHPSKRQIDQLVFWDSMIDYYAESAHNLYCMSQDEFEKFYLDTAKQILGIVDIPAPKPMLKLLA